MFTNLFGFKMHILRILNRTGFLVENPASHSSCCLEKILKFYYFPYSKK